jgi:hypothetical protein
VGGAVRREDRSRPWEEPDPPSTRMPTSPTSSSPSTSRRHPRLLPCRRAAPPLYTDACTTARGHRGENDRFPPLVDAPAFEPRWNAPFLRAAADDAGLRARLGQYVCRCRCLRQRAPLSWPSFPLSLIERRALLLVSAAPRRAVRARVRARRLADLTPRATVHPSTCTCRSRGPGWALAPFLLRRTPPPR